MPGPVVVEGALMMCDAGTAPMPLAVTSQELVMVGGLLAATIADCVPDDNVPPFVTCNILTAAALGVPTPCVPAPVGPWSPGSVAQTVNGLPLLITPAVLQCGIGGTITITEPGQAVEESD
jgi:hypothetical protein